MVLWWCSVLAQPPAPEDLAASDGTYDKYVLIRWNAQAAVEGYKVFRRANPDHGSFQEITKGWQKSTWLCDYGAQPGVTYYYTVIGSRQGEESPMARLDDGFVATDKFVDEEPLLTSANGRYAEPARFLLSADAPQTEKKFYRAGETANFTYTLSNPYEVSVARTEIRYFLSNDATYDWTDRPLTDTTKTYSDFPAQGTFRMEESAVLPDGLTPGNYYLLIVNAGNGDLSQLRVSPLPLSVR